MIDNLNFLNIYLGKSNLIEASAGTGKTNILSLLYLRFLLNINIESNFLNLSINNILVVTFTDLACLEIKKRILDNIRKLRICFIKNIFFNDYIEKIFIYIKNIPNILNVLINYENNIDMFSIYTIHSFCKKILFSYFLNSNINSSLKILDYEYNFVYKIIIFFWRKYFYNLSYNLSKIVFSYWSNPDKLYNFIYPILNFIDFKFINVIKYNSIEDCYNKIIIYINNFKRIWIKNYKKVYIFFINLNNFYNIYNKKIIDIWFKNINLWCNKETINFYIPYCLKQFRYKYIIKYKFYFNSNIKNIFLYIEKLYIRINDLYNFIIFKCLKYIKKNIFYYKKKNNFISFNDLINKLNFILSNDKNNILINIIRNNFPISLIDEFQDTDFLQFNIFNNIYINNILNNTKIIFIGDPKQSIYTFRGANIFNYIKSKNNIDFLYILNINWRSSFFLVKSINFLFTRINNPFIFKDANYLLTLPSYKNKNLIIKNNNKIFNSINFFILNNLNSLNYKYKIAKFCSIKIYKILNSNNIFLYKNNNFKRKIIPSDVCILVHKNYEIKIFFDVLKKFFLPVNCILNKSNIFNSLEAKEVFFLLKAIIFPNSKLNIRNALSTNLFNYDLSNLDKIINDDFIYEKVINDFYNYDNIWNNNGIYCLLNSFLKNKIKTNFLNYKDEQYNVNILHISEILQKKYYLFNDKLLLLNWLNKKINDIYNNNNDNKEYYLRSFSYEDDGIKISTIHKSKGLQYNIVWMPFIFFLNKYNNYNIYHNRKNCRTNLDFLNFKKYNNLMNEELISEEMRLLYVSITRSVYICNIVLYKVFNKNFKFCFSSIGRIIGNNRKFNFSEINKKIFIFRKCKYINFKFINIINYIKKNNFYIIKYFLHKNNFKCKDIINIKRIINYSKIVLLNKKNILSNNNINNNLNNNIFFLNLPKGKNLGLFFHKVMEKINFNIDIDNNFLLKYIYDFNIKKKYFFNIKKILFNLLNVVLYPLNISLKNIKCDNILKEFDFILYIKKINFLKFNYIIKKYDDISCLCDNLNIKNFIKGYLNGIIDLIFFYKNKYYIVDYKSSWFGNNILYYNKENIINNMILKRYDIQYHIYSIALHNYLSLNVKNYNYSINFGGIYYIFLRGLYIENNYRSYNGILYIKPNKKLIYKLNNLLKI